MGLDPGRPVAGRGGIVRLRGALQASAPLLPPAGAGITVRWKETHVGAKD